MTSSILSLTIPEKTDGTIINPNRQNSPYTRYNEGKSSKLTDCRHAVKKCFGGKVRPTAGLCMIAFAVPLIVPGITLTVVAFEDEAGFSKYSALHILGMVLLGVAILLIASGILLNTKFKFKISPDVTNWASTHEKTTKEDNLDVVTASTNDFPNKNNPFAATIVPNSPPVSHIVKTEDNEKGNDQQPYTIAEVDRYSDTGQRHVSFSARKFSRGHNSTRKSFEDYSSSFDSFDSEDISSGSYILSEDIGGEGSFQEMKSKMGFFQEIDELRSFSTFKPGHLKKSLFSFEGFKYSSEVTAEANSNLSSLLEDKPESNIVDAQNDKIQSNHDSTQRTQALDRSQYDELPAQIPQAFKELSDSAFGFDVVESSPGSRQRLHGLSSDVLMTSTELLIGSCDSLKTHDVASEENMSYSNSSVFSLEPVLKSKENITSVDCTKDGFFAKSSTSNQTKTWAQSPPTTRPHSFPSGSRIPGSPGAALKKSSLNEIHITNLDEFSR